MTRMEAISLASAGLTHGTLTSRQLKFIRKKAVRGAPVPVAWCVPSPARLSPPIPSFFLGEVLRSPNVERGAPSRARGGRARPRVRESHRASRARSTPRFVFHLPPEARRTLTHRPSRPDRVFPNPQLSQRPRRKSREPPGGARADRVRRRALAPGRMAFRTRTRHRPRAVLLRGGSRDPGW